MVDPCNVAGSDTASCSKEGRTRWAGSRHRAKTAERVRHILKTELGREPSRAGDTRADLRDLAGQFVGTLDEREAWIITQRFGLDKRKDSKRQTYERIGQQLGISKERARQLTLRAMKKMQSFAAEKGIERPYN